MSVEPNKSIEAQLRAYAESRRLEAPAVFELDAPARIRFQEEVRRVYQAETNPMPAAVSWWFWTRVVLAGAAAALVLFASVQLWPGDEPLLLSQKTEGPADRTVRRVSDRSQEPLSPTSPPPVPTEEQLPREGVARTAHSAAPVVPMVVVDSEAVASLPSVLEAGATGARSEVSIGVMALSDDRAGEDAQGAQTFQQVQRYRRNLNSPPTPQVLQTFRWLREGDTVRVIDADGSVYAGEMAAPIGAEPVERARIVAPSRLSADRESPDRAGLRQRSDAATAGERFAVSGTNRTMNVRVVFEGVVQSQAGRDSFVTSAGRGGKAVDVAMKIQGQAVVGSSTRLEIEAVPQDE
jgi:hypothetical protein